VLLPSLTIMILTCRYFSAIVTHTVSLPSSVVRNYITPLQTPLSKFTTKLLGFLFDLLEKKLNYTAMNLHDPLCIGFFIDIENVADIDEVGWQVQERDIRIEVVGTLTRGMLVVDRRKKSTKAAPGFPSITHVVLKVRKRLRPSHFEVILPRSNFSPSFPTTTTTIIGR